MQGIYDIKIGFKCNNNCAHCVVAEKRWASDLPLTTIFKEIEQVPDGLAVQVTGGEPTIYPYLPDILAKCHQEHHATILQTNGTGFSDLSFLEACQENLDHVHIAIHSCDPEVHDKIVNSSGMWQKTIQGLDNLISTGIFFTTQTVLSKYNMPTLYQTYQFIQQKKPGTVMSMTYPHLMGNAWTNREQVAFQYSEYKDTFQKVLQDFRDVLFVEAIPPCYLHPFAYEVETQMDDILGAIQRIGIDCSSADAHKNYNIQNLQDYRKAPRCKECIYNYDCIGVWKEYIELYKNHLDLYPIKEGC